MSTKVHTQDLALFGAAPLFEIPRSISNLVRPDIERFLDYSKTIFATGRYTGHASAVSLLEQRLAEFHQTKYCVAVCGGFWAVVLAIKCLALPGKTEVVMPSLTYRRLADCVAWAGLTPHFCEVDERLLCVTAETVRPCINENTALLLGVHPIINGCDVGGLEQLSAETRIPLVFDSVEAAYSSYKGRYTGSFGHAECFSMQSSKFLNAFEGGYVTTNDHELASRLALVRDTGTSFSGSDSVTGINAAQNEIHAAMALAALDDAEAQVGRNKQRYETYRRLLSAVPGVRLVEFDERERCGYKNIVIELLDDWPLDRGQTIELLHAENMLVRAYYAPPLHQMEVGYETIFADMSLTDRLSERFLCLPCGHFVSDDDINSIVALLDLIQANADDILERIKK
ncbi:dTDP-4-amino-4,6-dideoxygalactose transaminase [Paraburkholderia sp. GAS448]|uniref:DegT/DnrJ/EryC1/StrS family aminotransferase n=1 Tax=Paraburkholderia sp. GAS448 TaxID=3035136 RepID=UPI003D221B54